MFLDSIRASSHGCQVLGLPKMPLMRDCCRSDAGTAVTSAMPRGMLDPGSGDACKRIFSSLKYQNYKGNKSEPQLLSCLISRAGMHNNPTHITTSEGIPSELYAQDKDDNAAASGDATVVHTTQHNTTQHTTIHYNTIRYSTIQHKTDWSARLRRLRRRVCGRGSGERRRGGGGGGGGRRGG